ncbi:MAG TPA: aldolase/citrate lyase family protein [Bacteroidales bacterium]|nr:aldolase/citrate lyase family protein [Bacteroidales bacterium]
MKKAIAITGNAGPKVRSDCEITLELKDSGGKNIDLVSKVKALYGDSIISLTSEILDFFGIRSASVKINDSGALPFVIAARLESAIKKLIISELDYLPEFIQENGYSTTPERFRFSRLYLPGNSPGLMINAGLHSADGIILDLEDSVALEKKDEARILVRNALRQIDFYGAERMVRINQGDKGLEDLHFVIPQNVNLILIPKCESADYVKKVDDEISAIKVKFNLKNRVFLMPIIESALGIENSFKIARSSENVVAIAIGLEDYTDDLGVARTTEGRESLYARSRLIVAAKAAGIQPIDSVFSDVSDMKALKENVIESKAMGFEGMGCIHPRQIPVIQQGFSPDENEIEKAKKIVFAFEAAKQKGLGVVALGSKMIDPPVVARAQKTIDRALRLGILSGNWSDNIPVNDI